MNQLHEKRVQGVHGKRNRWLLAALLSPLALYGVTRFCSAQEQPVPNDAPVTEPQLRPVAPVAATVPTTAPTTTASTEPTTSPTTAASVSTVPYDPDDTPENPGAPVTGSVSANAVQKAKDWISSKRSNRTSSGDSRDARNPGRTDSMASAKALPKEYALLETRSIFSRQPLFEPRPPRTREEASSQPAPPPTPQRAETLMSLTGLAEEDGVFVALVEDSSAAKTLKLRVGDPVCRGKVSAMTLSTLAYESAGKVTQVRIGQNFDGGAASVTASTPVAPSGVAGLPSAAGGPPRPGSATQPNPAGGAVSATSIIEKLRLKRLAEMGGK